MVAGVEEERVADLGRRVVNSSSSSSSMSLAGGWVVGLAAVLGFHAAQGVWGGFSLLFLYGVLRLSELGSWRKAFYAALAVGYAAYGPHVAFMWTIFGPAALLLWGILAFWLGVFVVLARCVRLRWGESVTVWMVPWLWLGTEYFRSELYYLRFSWLSVGYAFSSTPGVIRASGLGVYGIGFAMMVLVVLAQRLSVWRRAVVLLLGLGLAAGLSFVQQRDIPDR